MQMMPQMGYDRAITVFSPDGRLFQVEYAREAVKRGTTAVGIKVKSGVVLLVDKRVTSRLLEAESIEKIFQIDDHIGVATSGLVADARSLVDRGRVEAQINRVVYDEPIGVEVLAKKICDFKQTYTQFGGVRPFGTALLIAGVDRDMARLFETDPSGALLEYKATAIGAGRSEVMEYFEEHYAEDLSLDGAIHLGLDILHSITEGRFDVDTIEVGVIELETRKFRRLDESELGGYLQTIRERHAGEGEEGEEA
ncbi:MAG: archaeal proteasome endopeptidase complex subunit alpha [Candidatus Syntropharchaeales archaeon]|nr:archaeal proteasome endopeptidase complex subunit alpha [Candidatus Syntrophoarchaeum sp.]